MVERNGVKGLRIVFVPRHVHARTALHSVATVASLFVAFRMGSGSPWWTGVAWYCGSFVGVHAVMVPFMAAWYMASDRVERWIRGIVEEELIRFDLQTYERQLKRVFPGLPKPPDEPPAA
jgi:hypothetical protein